MRLAVIGTGHVGTALGKWAARAGYTVLYAGRDNAKTQKAAAETGHQAQSIALASVAQQADLLLLAVPFNAVPDVLATIGDLRGKVIIDLTNPLTPAHDGLSLGFTTSGAEEIARLVPGATIVKAFNATFAEIYASGNPTIDGRPITIYVAGDDAAAKAIVTELVKKLGFDAVDAGPLKNARYLEPLSMLNIFMGRIQGLGTQIGYALLR